MKIEITDEPFNPWQLLQQYEQERDEQSSTFGATNVFVGTMRDFNEGDPVTAMTLEHYPGMTDKYLQRIAQEAMVRWDLLDALVVHRVGAIRLDETIVLLATWSAHRGASFEASRYLIEELKHRAPFWKKETLAGGERWVENNTKG
ncbi:MAG: molybdenum cofactor biosynthesis protein MoaE [Gammaproteobacteria bacterium]|nr:molybdenum cofactor biosynthesis protein MoaE [Gammaproteobacteria bacterium]